jgi:hypothetical protein
MLFKSDVQKAVNLIFNERLLDEDVDESGTCDVELLDDVVGRNFADDFHRHLPRIRLHPFALQCEKYYCPRPVFKVI